MDKTHTTALLDLLEKPELAALERFLKPPVKEIAHRLFLELHEPEKRAAKSPQDVFAKVFNGEPFDGHKWNKALSDLNGCIRDFLAVQQLRIDPLLRAQADVSAFFKRTDERFFERTVVNTLKNLPGNDAGET
ncbi:MAG TPA: hypothetical protein PK228_18760, partial [Saprospiraceae bacterium]|nr:hypothetical protein [Saprospiraceae bacterium]